MWFIGCATSFFDCSRNLCSINWSTSLHQFLHTQGYWTPPEEAVEDTEDTFSLPTLPPIDEKLIADAPPNLRGMRKMAAWEDESGVIPSDIQASPSQAGFLFFGEENSTRLRDSTVNDSSRNHGHASSSKVSFPERQFLFLFCCCPSCLLWRPSGWCNRNSDRYVLMIWAL